MSIDKPFGHDALFKITAQVHNKPGICPFPVYVLDVKQTLRELCPIY